ncbi:unnamed protein product [Lactuca virosa]|uniref:Uncharacterized protein n=1 Tax=Lactuca virosa TaxID=75947 RepID=A0AAU9MP98_9ASTR|nr:unnamed protein product [Lactuca virosa]
MVVMAEVGTAPTPTLVSSHREQPTSAPWVSGDSSTTSRNRFLTNPVVESLPGPDRRETITRVLTGFGKFVVDSAVSDSLKGRMQVYKIVKEGLKDEAPVELANLNNKAPHTLMMEEMQARMEKME